MRIFRICVATLFIIVFIVFAIFYVRSLVITDKTIPEILFDEKEISVSVNATEKDLMSGIRAMDGKDGDITDKVIIQNISNFVENSTCVITYMVWDSDNNYASAERTVHYVDYVSPKITLTSPLMFKKSVAVNFRDCIGATDVIDGDISNKVIVNSSNIDEGNVGDYEVIISIANSKGDRVSYTLPLTVYSSSDITCDLRLSEYVVYTKIGKEIDFRSYFVGCFNKKGEQIECDIDIKTYEVDFSKEGVYRAKFETTGNDEFNGFTYLTIIVEK